jgi:putative metallopeptidase DUF4344
MGFRFQRRLNLILALPALTSLCIDAAQAAPGDLVPHYGNVQNSSYQQVANWAKQSRLLENLAGTISPLVDLPQPVTVALAECGQINAYYTRQQRGIVLCVELVGAVLNEAPKKLWSWGTRCPYPPTPVCDRAPTREETGRTVRGALLFVLAHELGHALVDLLQLPVLGREEDAADRISMYLLTRTPFGPETVSGAYLFFESTKPFLYSQTHFAGEHSVNSTRRYNVYCWAFGSDPQRYAYLVQRNALPRQRANRCPGEYEQMARTVHQLLGNRVR